MPLEIKPMTALALWRDVTMEGVRADIKVLPIAAAPSRDVVAAWRSWETMPIATRKFIDYMSSHIEA